MGGEAARAAGALANPDFPISRFQDFPFQDFKISRFQDFQKKYLIPKYIKFWNIFLSKEKIKLKFKKIIFT